MKKNKYTENVKWMWTDITRKHLLSKININFLLIFQFILEY